MIRLVLKDGVPYLVHDGQEVELEQDELKHWKKILPLES